MSSDSETPAAAPPARPFPAWWAPVAEEGIAWVVALVAVLATIADVVFGVWDHDHGYYLLRAVEVASGLKPYIDGGTIYPPLMEVLMAPLINTGIARIVLAVLIPVGWILANALVTGLLTYAASRDRGLSVLVGSFYPLFSLENGGNHLTLEHGVAFFGSLAFLCLVRPGALTPRWVAATAVFASCAMLVKQNGVIVYLPVAAFFLTRLAELRRAHVMAFLAGSLAVPLALFVWLEGNAAAIYKNLVTRLGYYAADSNPAIFSMTAELSRAPHSVSIFILTAVAAVILMIRTSRWRLPVLAAAVGAVIQFLPRFVRDYPHYTLNMWPFLALIVVLALVYLNETSARAIRVFLALFAVIGYLTVFLSGRWGAGAPLFTSFYPAAQIVANVTPPNALVRAYGAEPIIEFLASRRREALNKPRATVTFINENVSYPTPPAPSTTIVIASNHPWVNRVISDHERMGFRIIAVVPRLPGAMPIVILRHASTLDGAQ